MFKLNNLPLTISTIVLISLIVGWGISMVLAWIDPTDNPPLDNVSAPINVSLTAQTKAGDLNVGSTIQLEAVPGDVTANTFLGKISAANVTSGEFGSGTGNFYFPARVGIGTTSPDYQLQVENSTGSAIVVITSNDNNNSQLLLGDMTNVSSGRIEYENSANRMVFYTNLTQQMTISNTGDITATGIICDVNGCIGANGGDGNNYTTGISFSGTTTKTLTVTRSGLTDLTANFTDTTIDGCTNCLNATEIADIYVLNTSDTMSGTLQVGGGATVTGDVTATGTICDVNGCIGAGGDGVDGCTDCLNATEIEDIYVLNTSDTMTGTLQVGGGSIEINKSGTDSDIFFTAQTNDPGYIKHYESSNIGIMYFSASDDKTTGDYFSFGSTPGGAYNEGARLTTSGNLQLDGSLTVSGGYFYGYGGQESLRTTDEWLRLNQAGHFANGTYTPYLMRADGGFQVDGLWAINSANTQHRVTSGNSYSKYCLWNGSTYCIGMYSAQTYGGLGDYAMTFTMNNDSNRGWLWRDSADAASDGAMSLTTTGVLTVKTSLTVGKIYVGTIDPIYEIDGKKYATYVSDFAGGVRTETSGVIQLNSEAKYVIDFDNLEKGSDLWLFWETSNKEMDDLVVILTPNFDGKVWYEYEREENKLIIYGKKLGKVSYRLTLPRLDDEEWENIVEDHENKEN